MILMMPLMVESPTREEKVIEYIGSCTYNHFLDWLDDAKDFVISLDDEGMYQLEAMIRDQVLADKGLPNDRSISWQIRTVSGSNMWNPGIWSICWGW